MTGRLLLASIHDVSPRFESEVDRLAAMLAGLLGGERFAMLVVPDHHGEAPLAAAPAFQRRLRGWAEAGVEMFVHGWFHQDEARHAGIAAWKARHMTAREGEFLGLSRDEAARRMGDGRKLIEDITGRGVAGFIAPAWLYGAGAHAALRDSGFALAEDHFRVWQPDTGRILARGPVITWASRSRARQLSSRGFASVARVGLKRARVVRIAVHPGDVHVPALLGSIGETCAAFAGHRAGRYADLTAGASSAPGAIAIERQR